MMHRTAVARLVDSYRAIPPGAGVRLGKRTSNLFRPRAAASGPGLDVSGLTGVISLDADGAEALRAPRPTSRACAPTSTSSAATLPKG